MAVALIIGKMIAKKVAGRAVQKEGITEWYVDKILTLATEANISAMHKAALLVESDVKKGFTKQGGGRQYGKHVASKPGQPPAIDTGTLRSSIMSEVEITGLSVIGRVGPDVEKIAVKAEAGTDVNYGYHLELGTSKMQPRPFLRPALLRTRKQVAKIFKDANKKLPETPSLIKPTGTKKSKSSGIVRFLKKHIPKLPKF